MQNKQGARLHQNIDIFIANCPPLSNIAPIIANGRENKINGQEGEKRQYVHIRLMIANALKSEMQRNICCLWKTWIW